MKTNLKEIVKDKFQRRLLIVYAVAEVLASVGICMAWDVCTLKIKLVGIAVATLALTSAYLNFNDILDKANQ